MSLTLSELRARPLPQNASAIVPDGLLARITDLENAANLLASVLGLSTSPLTTKGDLWGYSTTDDREPVGTDGQVLTADSTADLGVSWGNGETYAAQSQASAATISFTTARVHKLTLTGTPVTITLSGATSGVACGLTIYLVQDGTGSRFVTWPGSVKWPNGFPGVLSTTAGAIDIVVLESTDGGTTWFANLAGRAYA